MPKYVRDLSHRICVDDQIDHEVMIESICDLSRSLAISIVRMTAISRHRVVVCLRDRRNSGNTSRHLYCVLKVATTGRVPITIRHKMTGNSLATHSMLSVPVGCSVCEGKLTALKVLFRR